MFDILEFINRIFKKGEKIGSGIQARDRLKLVLISDRASVSPHIMESLREELIEVISRYMTIDTSSMEMGLERKGNAMALAANIPIVSIKRDNKQRTGGNGESLKRAENRTEEEQDKDKDKIKTTKMSESAVTKESAQKSPEVMDTPGAVKPPEREVNITASPEEEPDVFYYKSEEIPGAFSDAIISHSEQKTEDVSSNPNEISRGRRGRKASRRYLARASGGRRLSRRRTAT